MKKFNSKKLELMRRERHLTQDELAKELDISRVTVNYWENEKRTPNVYELSKLAKFFNVSEEQLVYDSKSNEAVVRKNAALALKDLEKNPKWLAEKLKLPADSVEHWLEGKHPLSRLQIDRIISTIKEAGINIIESFEATYSMPIPTKIINVPILHITEGRKAGFFRYCENEYEDFMELPISLFSDATFIVHYASDHMLPEIPANSFCVIKKMISPLNDKNMLIKTDMGYTIAKLSIQKGEVTAAHNSKDKRIKTNKLEIIGKVLGCFLKDK
ncbi:MAG: helix-turn-helix domain-containing protein [Endomicrobia bacterium]|nr:helix-turn-helix domain-containing protein [Endomicrobiia bacterium]